ncbi:MAG: S-layer homology domain-containing protein [Oscillospiraceae bacterium]
MFGALYTAAEDGQALADTDACYYQASFSQLDLDTAAYLTGSYRTRYTVCIPFTAVGTAGTRCEGSAVVTVSGDSTITASGAFLKTLDAAGRIAQQYPDAVCVSFQQPETSAGRLLKGFRSVAGSAYTAVRYPEDRFYLTDDGKSEPLLDALYFLPAADCASQLKLVYTAYDSGGTQLGTGELTVRVTSKQSSAVFSDVNAGTCAWAADAVDFMNGYGLIQGADASTFNWRGSMTRGDLILILYRSAGSPAVSGGSLPFTDVSESDYAYDAVVWAWKNGVAGGVSETEFCMKQAVTREQLASILYRLSGKPAVSASLRSYTDASDVSAYAVDAMRWAVGCGYLKGSGAKLNPQTGANRAEVAVLLHRYLTK